MKPSIRLGVCALLLAGSCWLASGSADLDKEAPTGHVLVLENERVIEGDIEKEGKQYHVRRPVGETVVPAEAVLHLCATMADAYDFLRSQANLRDVDECLRLARWCQLHGLKEQALAEAKAAVELRPHSAECRRLLQNMQRLAAGETIPADPKPVDANPPANPTPAVEISAESMGQFATKVQPILMNTCASCHVPARGGNFKLTRALEEGMLNRKATQQNLAAVLAQVTFTHWETSPLLTKAVSVHGDASQPPLKGRQVPAFRTLEEWVRGTMANNPQLQEHAAPVPAKAEVTQARPSTEFAAPKSEPAASNQPPAPPETAPAHAPTAPVDPFDPALFNQQMHPRQGADQPVAGTKDKK